MSPVILSNLIAMAFNKPISIGWLGNIIFLLLCILLMFVVGNITAKKLLAYHIEERINYQIYKIDILKDQLSTINLKV
jgi:hypothetical protein